MIISGLAEALQIFLFYVMNRRQCENVHTFCCIVIVPLYQSHQSFGQCMSSEFCHWQAEGGWTMIQMVLSKSRKHSISELQNDSPFSSLGLDLMVLIIPDSSVFSVSLQLNWRLALEEVGLCQGECISPCLKSQLSWILLQWRWRKRGNTVLPIGEHSMMHGILLAMWLRVPFSFLLERTKLFCLKSLVLLIHYDDLFNGHFSTFRIKIDLILNKWFFLATVTLYFSHTL